LTPLDGNGLINSNTAQIGKPGKVVFRIFNSLYLILIFTHMVFKCPFKAFLTYIVLINGFNVAFAQAPKISYPTPQNYPLNKPISPLAPKNTGGAVPVAIYGQVSTLAGSGTLGNADGIATSASFRYPTGLATDASGNIFVADYDNNTITPSR
jgi:hypothetical protein